MVAHGKRAARERRRRRSKVSRRRRAGHAPPARRGRRVRVPPAFKRPAKTLWWWWWWWWCAHQLRITSGWLPLIGGSMFRVCQPSVFYPPLTTKSPTTHYQSNRPKRHRLSRGLYLSPQARVLTTRPPRPPAHGPS